MKRLLTLFTLSFALSQAHAALILYEPFDYSNVGGPVNANTPANWATNVAASPNDFNVESGSLSYAGFAPSIGNSGTNGGAGLGVRRLWGTPATSDTVYFSVLFNMNSLGSFASGTAGAILSSLTQPDNSTQRAQVFARTNSGGFQFGLAKGGTASTTTYDATVHLVGEPTFLLVGSYNFDPVGVDVVSLWINPDSSTFGAAVPPATTLTASTGVDASATGFDRFNFRQNAATDSPNAMQWDELRIGDTWADVTPVPEPSIFVLTGLGLLGLGAIRLARRH